MRDQLDHLATALAGRYSVRHELGSGGMATVYLAEDARHGRQVAIKVLRPEFAQSIGAARFLREIGIAAKLTHPNIVTLIDSGEADGLLYYTMPFVEGESLRDRLTREPQLPLDEAIRITEEVADALAYAHSLGFIHRDIKPENILFEAGHAVVTDFGIARAVSEAGGERLTETGMAVGTPAYMSPEQALGTHQVDARSDIYSLGCVVYEMLAGDPPFVATTPQSLLARKTTDPIPKIRVVRDTVPPRIEAIVTKALAKVPADRFATVQQFRDALAGADVPLDLPTEETPSRAVPGWVLRVGGVAAVAVIAGLVLLWGGDGAPPVLQPTFLRLTADPGVEWFPTLSPDGEWLVYAGEGAGNRDIFLKSVGGQNTINLTPDSPDDDDQPAFSPDGQRIAFRSSRDGGGLFVMGRTGEAVRRITRAGFKPSWSPDGTALVYATENVELNPQNSEGESQLWVVDIATGEQRQIDVVDGALPSWSPSGARIAFTRRLGSPARADIWTVPAEGGEAVAITNDVETDWYPTWSPDGNYLYFSSDRGGSMNLWRVRVDERTGETRGPLEPVTTPAVSLDHISVSGRGDRLVYSASLVTSNIQSARLNERFDSIVGDPSWVTTGSRRWASPDPSPDGTWVTFYSLVNPEGHVYVTRPDGSGLRPVTSDTAIDRVPRWSPDGQWIGFFSNRDGPLAQWMIRPDGSDLTRIEPHAEPVGVWHPDGTRMVAPLRGESGVYVFEFRAEPGAKVIDRLPDPPDDLAAFRVDSWSPDGRRLVGDISYRDAGVVMYSFDTQQYERLTERGQWPVWLPDSRHVLYVSGQQGFYVVDRVTKRVREIHRTQWDVLGPPRTTRDGRRMYYSRRVTQSDIWLATLQ